MKLLWWILLSLVVVLPLTANTTVALKPFKKAFDQRYVKKEGDEDFRAAFKRLSCNTCHIKGKKRDYVNAYGKVLADLIQGNAKDRLAAAGKNGSSAKRAENDRILQELEAAFKKAEGIPSPSGPTYGELFRSHKLPSDAGAESIR